jgi:hypothetical protein
MIECENCARLEAKLREHLDAAKRLRIALVDLQSGARRIPDAFVAVVIADTAWLDAEGK